MRKPTQNLRIVILSCLFLSVITIAYVCNMVTIYSVNRGDSTQIISTSQGRVIIDTVNMVILQDRFVVVQFEKGDIIIKNGDVIYK